MTVIGTGGVASLFERRHDRDRPLRPRPHHPRPARDLPPQSPCARRMHEHAFATRRRARLPAARRLQRNRHELQPLRLWPAARPQVDHRRSRASPSATRPPPGSRSSCPTRPSSRSTPRTSWASSSPTPMRTTSARWAGSGRGCKAPLYATPFTAFLLREKLREKGLLDEARITEIPLNGSISLGPFDLDPDHPHPFDPRAQWRGDPDAAGDGAAHRRLEDRSRPA